jgi:hypothetical protein
VTFPFVSKGGSSLVASWGLLAFIKASDSRQNASFVLKLPKRLTRQEKVKIMSSRPEEWDDGGNYPDFFGEEDVTEADMPVESDDYGDFDFGDYDILDDNDAT